MRPRFEASPWRWATDWFVRLGYGGFYAYHVGNPEYAWGPYDTIAEALERIETREGGH